MIAENVIHRIRAVTIYYWDCILGFSFFDKDEKLLWQIGNTWAEYKETVLIADDEVIVGVEAKLDPGYQSRYSDF